MRLAEERMEARSGAEDISVIICAFTMDRWGDLVRSIESIRRQTQPARELILVVDRSPELQRRAEAELSGVRIVANAYQGGLSGARQTGADVASGSILAYLDDDAMAEPEWLAEMERAHADDKVLGVGGHVEPNWLQPPPRWFPPEFNWVVGCSHTGMPTATRPVRNPIGANMAVRAEVLRRTGPFAFAFGRTGIGSLLGGTAEETEFCIRASGKYPGHYWLYHPTARVHHTVPPQRGTWSYFVSRCRVEGQAKALLSELAGSQQGLASERTYVRSVLPRAVARDLRAAGRGDFDGLRRAAAIVAGLAITTFEYLRTRARSRRVGVKPVE
jgi:cellulose synthase/poly-beta-1,6-N-acetylglucosamine synthase-like glycosyltransferase